MIGDYNFNVSNHSENPSSSCGLKMLSSDYVSCIKINGQPILPPLMTEKKIEEMKKFKYEAMLVEEKLKKAKSLMCSNQKHLAPLRPSSLNLPFRTLLPVNNYYNKLPLPTDDVKSSQCNKINRKIRNTIENQLATSLELDDLDITSSLSSSSMTTWSEVSEKSSKNWSPLKTDSLRNLKVKPDVPLEQDVDTSATITPSSPKLLRQGSYTVLTPSPALVNSIDNNNKKSNRKTWDLSRVIKNWNSESDSDTKLGKSPSNNKFQQKNDYYRNRINLSCDFDSLEVVVPLSDVPLVQSQGQEISTQTPYNDVPSCNKQSEEDDLPNLNELLLKMKLDHERQRKELEERQRQEQETAEKLFRLQQRLTKSKSFDAQPKQFEIIDRDNDDGDMKVGLNHSVELRPQSARDNYQTRPIHNLHEQIRPSTGDVFNVRSRSYEFHNLLPTSPYVWKGERLETDTPGVISDTDCYSDMSSYSSECRQDISLIEPVSRPVCNFQVPPGQYETYNKAALVITAAGKGFLVRRLLKTAHVKNLITILRDAIKCAMQLNYASDLSDSDVTLMHRLRRQIEAAWEDFYNVFFNMTTVERLCLISADRERIKNVMIKSTSSAASDGSKRISSATQKSLIRKQSRMIASYDGSTPTTAVTRRQRLCCNRMSNSCDETTLLRPGYNNSIRPS